VCKNLNYKYEVILYWSAEDVAFIAEVPELPSCFADGATQKQAIDNAQIVIAEWIETVEKMERSVPNPRGRLKFA